MTRQLPVRNKERSIPHHLTPSRSMTARDYRGVRRYLWCLILASTAAFSSLLNASPNVISINFVGGPDFYEPAPATPLAAAEVAGVVASSNWNNVAESLPSGSAAALVSSTGAVTGAGVSWSTTYCDRTTDTNPDPNHQMMCGFVVSYGYGEGTPSPATASVTGLPYGTNDIYVYYGGQTNGTGSAGKSISTYAIGDQTVYANDEGILFNGIFIQAHGTSVSDPNANGNYVLFKGVTGTSFNLAINAVYPVGLGQSEGIRGIQIVPSVPVPSFTNITVSHGTLVASGSGGVANGNYYIQFTTNLLSNPWITSGTNKFDGNGDFAITNVISTDVPQLYFKILSD